MTSILLLAIACATEGQDSGSSASSGPTQAIFGEAEGACPEVDEASVDIGADDAVAQLLVCDADGVLCASGGDLALDPATHEALVSCDGAAAGSTWRLTWARPG